MSRTTCFACSAPPEVPADALSIAALSAALHTARCGAPLTVAALKVELVLCDHHSELLTFFTEALANA